MIIHSHGYKCSRYFTVAFTRVNIKSYVTSPTRIVGLSEGRGPTAQENPSDLVNMQNSKKFRNRSLDCFRSDSYYIAKAATYAIVKTWIGNLVENVFHGQYPFQRGKEIPIAL